MSRHLDCLPGLMYGAPGDLISFLIKCHVIKKDALFYLADIQLTVYLKTPGGASSSLVCLLAAGPAMSGGGARRLKHLGIGINPEVVF